MRLVDAEHSAYESLPEASGAQAPDLLDFACTQLLVS
jgi:hypothetical protein